MSKVIKFFISRAAAKKEDEAVTRMLSIYVAAVIIFIAAVVIFMK